MNNQDDILYGLDGWERLEFSFEDATERVLDDAVGKIGETFDETAETIEWPVQILEYKRCFAGGECKAKSIAKDVLDDTLERLDVEYMGDCDEVTEPTQDMEDTALAFGRIVALQYVSWTCEPNGKVIEYTREQAKADSI